MSIEEFKSALDMFQMKSLELTNRMKSTANDTTKAGYQAELDTLKAEKEAITKLIESDKKDRKGITRQFEKVKS
jgi:cell division protein FtsB